MKPTGSWSGDRAVAQVSKPAVSRVSNPQTLRRLQSLRTGDDSADLEIGDTAGLETCATSEGLNTCTGGAGRVRFMGARGSQGARQTVTFATVARNDQIGSGKEFSRRGEQTMPVFI